MKRRAFLAALGSSSAGFVFWPAASSAQASKRYGVKITINDPPEPGFEHVGNRRYRAFCNGEELKGVVRVDTGNGIAWIHARNEQGVAIFTVDAKGDSKWAEVERHGRIELVRVQDAKS